MRLTTFAAVAALLAGGVLQPRAPEHERPAGAFTVMTFNIQHGMTAAGKYDLQKAIDVIAKVQPDIVGLQETTRNHPVYNCDDQPRKIADAVSRVTGRSWTEVYEQEWFTPDTSCRDRGAGDGKETEGLTILSPHPLDHVSRAGLWNTRVALAARTRAIGPASVIVTHLASGTDDRRKRDRTKQLAQLFPWADHVPAPRILVGDFNIHEDSDEYAMLVEHYHDAWADAAAAGRQRGVASGQTRVAKPGRIDYVLYTPSPALTLDWVEVVDTKALVGAAASDHQPIVAEFRVR